MTIQEILILLNKLTVEKDYDNIKELLKLNDFNTKIKGDVFELYIKELYEGNGWICKINGGKDDKGADLLLSHPQTPSQIEHIIQVKNHSKPLNFKDTRSELVQFEKVSSKEYNCTDYKLISINGYVEDAKDKEKMDELQRFNISLLDFNYIRSLINTYKPISERKGIKPTLNLYAHNELSYKKILEKWEKSTRTCIIKATGLGKSKVILKVLGENFYDKNKIILAPSNLIIEQFKNDDDNWALNDTTFFTYQGLLLAEDEYISSLNPGVIVCDEFHRCGAEQWQKVVERLLSIYPNAKVLGTTATPIRSDSRDMSEELFYGNVANVLSVHEAIITKMLPMPKYISAIYDLSEEITIMKEKIESCSNTKKEKEVLVKQLEKASIDWENSNGIPKILKKHIPSKSGKGIVFCEDINHLNEMYITVERWFYEAGFDVKKNKVYSTYIDSDEEFREFKEAKSKNRINLLFSINVLNEGVHIKDVDFVIFLRKTRSEIIYLQQLGRVLQTDKKNTPIVFDFVCNFRNTKNSFVSGFEDKVKEINDARKKLELGISTTNLSIKSIRALILDESKDIKEVFDWISNALITSWEARYEELVEYFNVNGHSNVPNKYKENKQLATWVNEQRRAYKKNGLSQDKIDLLAKVNFSYNPIEDYWNDMYDELVKYFKLNGHSNVPKRYEENKQLGLWIGTQRTEYKMNKLSQDKIDLLSKVNFSYNLIEDYWNNMYEQLVEYFKLNGHSNVPNTYKENNKLGRWVGTQRRAYKNNELSQNRIDLLSKVNFSYNPVEDYWNDMYEELVEHFKLNGHSNVQNAYKENKELGNWISVQRRAYKKNELSQDKIDLLSKVNFSYNPAEDSWNSMYEELAKYFKINGHSNVPNAYKENKQLGNWVNNQRQSYKNNELSQDKIDLLSKVNFSYNPKEDYWSDMYDELVEYFNINGHTNVPQKYKENKQLGNWVSNQRQAYKKNKLSDKKIKLLEELNFTWVLK